MVEPTYYLSAIAAALRDESYIVTQEADAAGAIKRIEVRYQFAGGNIADRNIEGDRYFYIEIRDDVVFVSPAGLIVLDHSCGLDHKLELADPMLFTKIIRYFKS